MNPARLPTILIEPVVRQALLEDLGRAGDITTDAIAPGDLATKTAMVARQGGVVAGLDLAALAFRLIDPAIVFTERRPTARASRRARRSRGSRARRAAFSPPNASR